MAPRKSMQTVGGAFTDTVGAQFADPGGKDCFVPGWDRYAAGQQAMSRNKARAAMGKKMTPRGAGKLIPAKR